MGTDYGSMTPEEVGAEFSRVLKKNGGLRNDSIEDYIVNTVRAIRSCTLIIEDVKANRNYSNIPSVSCPGFNIHIPARISIKNPDGGAGSIRVRIVDKESFFSLHTLVCDLCDEDKVKCTCTKKCRCRMVEGNEYYEVPYEFTRTRTRDEQFIWRHSGVSELISDVVTRACLPRLQELQDEYIVRVEELKKKGEELAKKAKKRLHSAKNQQKICSEMARIIPQEELDDMSPEFLLRVQGILENHPFFFSNLQKFYRKNRVFIQDSNTDFYQSAIDLAKISSVQGS